MILAFDGIEPDPGIRARAERIGARIVALPDRRGPGAARNAGARDATGTWLAFTEEDCIPAVNWLERAAARIAGAPHIDVVEGETVTQSGGPVRRRDGGTPNYLPTNLFVRRDVFARAGGYSENYFDSVRGIYFREDSDFGFSLEAAGAWVAFEPEACVTHPAEHPHFLDPLRWARRYEMDALLQQRHPERFRTRIEVAHLGPFRLRRTVLRASFGYLISLAAGGAALLMGERSVAAYLVAMGGLMLIPIWAKWGFHPWRLPVVPLVPFVLAASYLQGVRRHRAPS